MPYAARLVDAEGMECLPRIAISPKFRLPQRLMQSVPNFTGHVEFAPGFAPRPDISHVLFDFDGTLSLIRDEADVLVATTIVENGLDIPRANTIL